MLATNALMLHFFVRGLHETDSLTATVTSAAVNFMLSVRLPAPAAVDPLALTRRGVSWSGRQAAVGVVVFQELLPTRWFVGAALILTGVACLLHGDTPVESPSTAATKKQQ